MKKFYLPLIIILGISLVVGCSSNELSQTIRYGKKVSQKIRILHNEKSDELSILSEKLLVWREEISNTKNTFYTIERNEIGNWCYYTDNYEWVPVGWDDNSIDEIMNILFNDYEVIRVDISDGSVKYCISEDLLIYSMNNIEIDSNTVKVEGNWYHFKFPYGI